MATPVFSRELCRTVLVAPRRDKHLHGQQCHRWEKEEQLKRSSAARGAGTSSVVARSQKTRRSLILRDDEEARPLNAGLVVYADHGVQFSPVIAATIFPNARLEGGLG